MSLWKTTRDLWHTEPRERVKLTLGRWLYPGPTRAWLSYLRADEVLWRQVTRFPQFVTRIYRPYALRTLTSHQRVQHMIGHYNVLRHLGLRALLEQSVDAPLPLVALPTKGQTPAELQLISVHDGHREGEAHLHLNWNGHRLYALSFLLRPHHQDCQLLVTRLQGSQDPQARDLIREATKGLHGLRPAVLMVQAVRQIARSMGAARCCWSHTICGWRSTRCAAGKYRPTWKVCGSRWAHKPVRPVCSTCLPWSKCLRIFQGSPATSAPKPGARPSCWVTS